MNLSLTTPQPSLRFKGLTIDLTPNGPDTTLLNNYKSYPVIRLNEKDSNRGINPGFGFIPSHFPAPTASDTLTIRDAESEQTFLLGSSDKIQELGNEVENFKVTGELPENIRQRLIRIIKSIKPAPQAEKTLFPKSDKTLWQIFSDSRDALITILKDKTSKIVLQKEYGLSFPDRQFKTS